MKSRRRTAPGTVRTAPLAASPSCRGTAGCDLVASFVRAEGASYAVLSFTRKAGQGIGGAAAAYTIGLGGYESGAASQSAGAVTAIKIAVGIVPAVAVAVATVVMLAYPLTERAFRDVVAELAERRAGRAGSPPAAARS